MNLIEARDVRKSFGQTPALRGASVAAVALPLLRRMTAPATIRFE
jgi:hypothetical protein